MTLEDFAPSVLGRPDLDGKPDPCIRAYFVVGEKDVRFLVVGGQWPFSWPWLATGQEKAPATRSRK